MTTKGIIVTNDLRAIARSLSEAAEVPRFGPPVSYVYNPLTYAWDVHSAYLEKYGGAPKEVVLVGMNPGPWGMAQTGVPFGEVSLVREWLKIFGRIERPKREHPKKIVEGFACHRSEVSGRRLWGWARDRFKTPERFFERFFVANYCPLLFLEASGRNLTPDRLPATERRELLDICDRSLRMTIEFLAPRLVVGVGRFAEERARKALVGHGVEVGRILHPSPASPAANRGWEKQASNQLRELGIRV